MTALCNFCAQTFTNGCLVDLSASPLMMEKVQKYLPCLDMKLKPLHMCPSCKGAVDQWNVFYLKCAHVQKSLPSLQEKCSTPPVVTKRKRTYCCAKYCANTDVDEKMFHLPKIASRAKQWLLNADRLDLLQGDFNMDSLRRKNLTLCRQHFESKMFNNELKLSLVSNALPTLFKSGLEYKKAREEEVQSVVYEGQRKIRPKPPDHSREQRTGPCDKANPASLPENKENKTSNLIGPENATNDVIGPIVFLTQDTSVMTEQYQTTIPFPINPQVVLLESNVPTGSQVVLLESGDSNVNAFQLENMGMKSGDVSLCAIDFHAINSNSCLNGMGDLHYSDAVILSLDTDLSKTNTPSASDPMSSSHLNCKMEEESNTFMSTDSTDNPEDIMSLKPSDSKSPCVLSGDAALCETSNPSTLPPQSSGSSDILISSNESQALSASSSEQNMGKSNEIENLNLNSTDHLESNTLEMASLDAPEELSLFKLDLIDGSLESEHLSSSIQFIDSSEHTLSEVKNIQFTDNSEHTLSEVKSIQFTDSEHTLSEVKSIQFTDSEHTLSEVKSIQFKDNTEHTLSEGKPSHHDDHVPSMSSYSVLDYDTSRLLNGHLVSSRMLMYSCKFCGDTLLTEGLLRNHCKLYHSMYHEDNES
ncbi:hypothetical protein M8J75_013848 [Diaphorina citri]|nr:hypothetical protein M8J75_013848 [Diaphorina citri]